MHCMVASSIPCKISLCADRAHARAGDSYVSSGIDVACPTTQSVLAIASPHELHGDSWPSSSTGTSSFCCNQQYSIIATTTSAGAIAERYAYTAYGQLTFFNASGTPISSSAIGNRYTYTGREWDAALALYHYRARMYDPLAGRFVSRDPIGYAAGSSNVYQFVRSKVLGNRDPFGLYQVASDDGQGYPPFDPGWIGSSGCFEYCIAAGHSPNRCNDYCGGRLPPTYPPFGNPGWPIAWGHQEPFESFPNPAWGNPDDGKGACKCTFDRNGTVYPGYHLERPRCADGSVDRPGLSECECGVDGSQAIMRYLGTCEKVGQNRCECSDSCFVYLAWTCRARSNGKTRWTTDLKGFYTPCKK